MFILRIVRSGRNEQSEVVAESIYKSPAGERAVMAWYDALLQRWPVARSEHSVATRHGPTFVIAGGNGSAPPLVLLHGAGTNSAMWAGDFAEYSRHYRVMAIDLLGEPGKSAPSRPSWSGPAYGEWLNDVLDSLHVDSAAIVGLSQGAWVALKLAVWKPERVRALVLLSPGGIVPDNLSFVLRALPLLLLGRWGARRINRMVLGGQVVPIEVEAGMALVYQHFKPRLGVLPLFSDGELRRLTMPVQLLIGGRDTLRSAEKITARMRKLVPHLDATVIPDAGHA